MQSSSTRTPKRTRIDYEGRDGREDRAAAPLFKFLTQDEEFWLPDGNIILLARGIGFRIYEGLLAAQSPIFSDMFDIPRRHLDESEHLAGVPIVYLSDAPEELRHLLRVLIPKIHDHSTLKDYYDLQTEFHTLSAIIRLSHKYQIENVERRALAALRDIYSSDLRTFTALDRALTEDDYAYAIGAVNIARLTSTPSILPAALYHCALLRGKVLDGLVREDGSVEYLSGEDVARCLWAVERLTAETAARSFALMGLAIQPDALPCKAPEQCERGMKSVREDMRARMRACGASVQVLRGYNDKPWKSGYPGLCVSCVRNLEARRREAVEGVWRRMPEIFRLEGLQGWPRVA